MGWVPGMKNRRGAVLVLFFMTVLINLPIVHGTWTAWRIDHSGVNVTAVVTDDFVISPERDPRYFLEFQYDEEFDPEQTLWAASVDQTTYTRATETEEIAVRVLADDPGAYKVAGQQTSRAAGWVISLLANLVLLSLWVLLWRTRSVGSGQADLHLVAVEDISRCKPGASVERVGSDTYLVSGEIFAITDDAVILDLGDRKVHVTMAGFSNPVGYQQPAQVTGRTLPDTR